MLWYKFLKGLRQLKNLSLPIKQYNIDSNIQSYRQVIRFRLLQRHRLLSLSRTWINYHHTTTRLKKEKYLFTLSSGDYAELNDNEKNRKFVERIEEFLSEEQDKQPEKNQWGRSCNIKS